MFKNRIRTAALAGAVAIATSISGLSVPAMAQQQETQQDRIQQATEGTKEYQLNEKLKAVNEVLKKYPEPITQEVADLGVSLQSVLAGNEAALIAAFKASKAEIDAARDQANQNVQTGNADVLAAKAADDKLAAAEQAVKDAEKAKADALAEARKALTAPERVAQQEKVNKYVKDAKVLDPTVAATELNLLSIETIADFDAAIKNFKDAIRLAQKNTIKPAASALLDQAHDAAELAQLRGPVAQLDPNAPGNLTETHDVLIRAAKKAEVAAEVEASKTDAVALQNLTQHAFNQLQALNVASNTYGTAIRYSEIENKDALLKDENKTVREFYNEVLRTNFYGNSGKTGLIGFSKDSIAKVVAAQAGANDYVGATPGDAAAYKKAREAFATDVTNAVVDPLWQIHLKRANLLDARYVDDIVTPNPAGGSSLSETAKKGLTIGGIIAGVLAALGAIGSVIWPHIKPIIDKFIKF